MLKRILLLVLTNVAVMSTIGVLVRVFGLDRAIDANGDINWGVMVGLSLVWGFTGSFISLLLSKPMAKWNVGARAIATPQNEEERWLVETVQRQAAKAGIGMPDVAIYESPEVNAFATGAFRNSALVAVSRGLLQSMERDEVEAVMAHEVSHVANGDMVTMTLLQGVVNSVVVFVTLLVRIALSNRRGGRRGSDGALVVLVEMVARIVLTFAGSLLCAYFSRAREFRADAGAAGIEGAQSMIRALQRLSQGRPAPLPGGLKAFGISGGVGALFATHPPLEKRIEALRAASGT
jgi:heat shock protein HtpX